MGHDLNSADQPDTDSQLVDRAWRQIAELETKPGSSAADPITGMRTHPLPADSFSGYRILREIHRGGQGVVYEAIQESTDRTVAIKVLKQGPFSDGAELARFEREVHVLCRLNHPNIVTIHDRGSSAGHAYLVMDYVTGRSLDQYLAGADCPPKALLSLFGKICEAVHAAHLRGIIHRDLKPGNIRIDDGGEPHVLDFGLAKLAGAVTDDSSAPSLTVTGQFVGSMPWTSPEQALGHEIDLRTDVYSLGVILYQMLTGALPYRATGPVRDVQDRILHAEPIRPSAVARDIDSDLDTIVLKCLAKQPERRYQSSGELSRDIRHYLAGEPIEARRDSFAYVVRKQLRRHKGPTAVAVAFVTMFLGGLAYCVTQWQRADREAGRARKAEGQATARADELEKVTKFQADQFSGIDARTMGIRLRADLLVKAHTAAERSKLPPEEADAHVAELEKFLAGSDFTGMASKSLDENFFQPALAAIEKEFADQPLVRARLLQATAITLRDLGLLEAATGPQAEALDIRRRELGDEHPDTLASMNSMGVLLRSEGRLPEAASYFQQVLEGRSRKLGEDHPLTLSAMSNMAALLKSQGRLSEAETYYRAVLKRRPYTLAVGGLGSLLQSQGKFADAEPFCQEAFERDRRELGSEHPRTLESMDTVGLLFKAQGKLAEAESYLREVLETRRRVLGEDHPDTLNSINNLGFLLQDRGKLPEAEQLLREAMEKRHRLLGDAHPDTLVSINNFAALLHAQGKLERAEPYFREVLEARRRVLGEEHPDTLAAISNLGALLQSRGRLEEAEPYTREAMEKSRRVLGDEHVATLEAINNMGLLLKRQGKLAEAEQYYREALELKRRVLGEENAATLTSINNLGVLLRSQGKLIEAEQYYREAMEKLRRVLGEEHRNTIASINNMGSLLQSQGKLEEAEHYYREALEKRRRVLSNEHPDTIESLGNIGALLKARGDLEGAEPYLRETAERSRKVLGEENTNTIIAINNLGSLLHSMGKLDEAEPYCREAVEKLRRVLGDEHPNTLRSICNLGSLHLARGQPAEAIALLTPVEPTARRVFTGGTAVGLGRLLAVLGRSRVATGAFDTAEANLVEAQTILSEAPGAMDKDRTTVLNGLIELYDAWHAAEPDKGYDAKSAECRKRLNHDGATISE